MAFSDAKLGTETHIQANPVERDYGSPDIVGPSGVRRDGIIDVNGRAVTTIEELEASKKGRFAFFKSRNFYVVLVLG